MRQYPVARSECKSVEGHVPGAGRVFDEGDFVGRGVDQGCAFGVERGKVRAGLCFRLVAADVPFELEMITQRVEDRLWHERGAGVVEVQEPLAGRCVGAHGIDVDHRRLLSRPQDSLRTHR